MERAAPIAPVAGADALAPGVLEVFASVQGEAAHAGRPQVFVRLAGCPLRCRYCDTPASWPLAAPGAARPSSGDVAERVRALDPEAARAVSITGGEPLLFAGFVRALARDVAPRRVHLETAGAHPAALARVLRDVHHVSLDLKLDDDLDAPVEAPAELGAGPTPADGASLAAARATSLRLVRGRDACAKVVVVGGTDPARYAVLLDEVAREAPELPVFVQPATPARGAAAPTPAAWSAVLEAALARGLDARVLPQVHRALDVR